MLTALTLPVTLQEALVEPSTSQRHAHNPAGLQQFQHHDFIQQPEHSADWESGGASSQAAPEAQRFDRSRKAAAPLRHAHSPWGTVAGDATAGPSTTSPGRRFASQDDQPFESFRRISKGGEIGLTAKFADGRPDERDRLYTCTHKCAHPARCPMLRERGAQTRALLEPFEPPPLVHQWLNIIEVEVRTLACLFEIWYQSCAYAPRISTSLTKLYAFFPRTCSSKNALSSCHRFAWVQPSLAESYILAQLIGLVRVFSPTFHWHSGRACCLCSRRSTSR